jgi:hypothetical protein
VSEIFSLVFSIVGSLLAAYALLYVGAGVLSPHFFLDDLSLNDARFRRLSESVGAHPITRGAHHV